MLHFLVRVTTVYSKENAPAERKYSANLEKKGKPYIDSPPGVSFSTTAQLCANCY